MWWRGGDGGERGGKWRCCNSAGWHTTKEKSSAEVTRRERRSSVLGPPLLKVLSCGSPVGLRGVSKGKVIGRLSAMH